MTFLYDTHFLPLVIRIYVVPLHFLKTSHYASFVVNKRIKQYHQSSAVSSLFGEKIIYLIEVEGIVLNTRTHIFLSQVVSFVSLSPLPIRCAEAVGPLYDDSCVDPHS